jgi:ribonuclease D
MPPADQADPSPEFIDTPEALTSFCASLKGREWIALDTEFLREKTYYPQLCLVQIGVPGRYACIDPLALPDLAPLYDILYDDSVTKVLHACAQDLEIFVHLTGRVPTPIFDTQLAAPLLGLPEQTGYGNFVKEVLGIELDKLHARTDWSRRPLSGAQLAYAADDVRYLAEAYPQVIERLGDKGRLGWLAAEFEPYESLERYQMQPQDAWKRMRGLEKLRPKALSIAQHLAAWREQQAQDKNLPRNWVVKDEVIIDLARLAPKQPEGLAGIRGIPAKTVQRYAATLLELIRTGADAEPQPLAGRVRRTRPSVQEEALADVLHAQLRLLADRHDINLAIIAGRKDLIALIRDDHTALLSGWRREIAGKELLALRDGQRLVSIRKGRVEIEAATRRPTEIH